MKKPFPFLIPVIIAGILLAGSLIIILGIGQMSPSKNFKVVVVVKATKQGMEFWGTVRSGIMTAAKEFDLALEIVGPPYESDIARQVAIMKEVIAKKPSAIILAASDYNLLVPLVEQADREGIKVITLDSGINSRVPASFVATNNVEAGEKAAGAMISLLTPGVPVLIISHVKETATAIEREEGVRRVFQASGRNPVIGTYYSDNYQDRAYALTKDLVASHPELGGIVALNEVSTVGVATALRDLGRRDLRLVGFDHSLVEIQFLEDGILNATVVQKPFNMGYLAVRKTVEVLEGKKVAPSIDTGSVLITPQNMYTPENQKLLFPFTEN